MLDLKQIYRNSRCFADDCYNADGWEEDDNVSVMDCCGVWWADPRRECSSYAVDYSLAVLSPEKYNFAEYTVDEIANPKTGNRLYIHYPNRTLVRPPPSNRTGRLPQLGTREVAPVQCEFNLLSIANRFSYWSDEHGYAQFNVTSIKKQVEAADVVLFAIANGVSEGFWQFAQQSEFFQDRLLYEGHDFINGNTLAEGRHSILKIVAFSKHMVKQ